MITYFVYDFTIYVMPPKFKVKYTPRAPEVPAPTPTTRPRDGKTLLIVESPAKCQKIEGYLGISIHTTRKVITLSGSTIRSRILARRYLGCSEI